jgi:hypothetical protein
MITGQSLTAKVGETASEWPVTKNNGLKAFLACSEKAVRGCFSRTPAANIPALKKPQWNSEMSTLTIWKICSGRHNAQVHNPDLGVVRFARKTPGSNGQRLTCNSDLHVRACSGAKVVEQVRKGLICLFRSNHRPRCKARHQIDLRRR